MTNENPKGEAPTTPSGDSQAIKDVVEGKHDDDEDPYVGIPSD